MAVTLMRRLACARDMLPHAQPCRSHTSAGKTVWVNFEACALTVGLARGGAVRHSTALGSLDYITSETTYSPWCSLAESYPKQEPKQREHCLFVLGFDSQGT